MARQIGTGSIGAASEAGLPPIGGVDAAVLALPALGAGEALILRPLGLGEAPLETWALGLDLYIPTPAAPFASLVQLGGGDAELFLKDNGDGTASVGIAGVYDGALAFDQWSRLIVTITEEAGRTVLRKYANGAQIGGAQDLGVTGRWDIDPVEGLKLLADDNGETAPAALSSVFFSPFVPTPPEVAGLAASIPSPDAGGFFPGAPVPGAVELGFANEDLTLRYGAAEVILEGFGFRTPVALNDSAIGFATQFGGEGPGGADVPVLAYPDYAPDEGVLVRLPGVTGSLSSYTAVWDVKVEALAGFQALLQTDASQGSDGELFIRGDGGVGVGGDYDGAFAPGAWSRIAVTVEDRGDGTATLSKYLDGAFLDSQTVNAARFTLGGASGFLLMTDNDGETGAGQLAHFGVSAEVLDAAAIAALGGADGDGPFAPEAFDAAPLPPTGDGLRDLTLSFDSSFRPYDGMTGEVLVSIDGGDFQSLLTLTTANSGGDSSLSRVNETIALGFTVAENAASVAFAFNLRDGGNDWWWAIDNLALTDESGALIYAENFDGLPLRPFESPTESAGDGTDWTDVPPAGWARDNTTTPAGNPAEFRGWTFLDKQSWIATAGNQERDEFLRGSGVVAVADPDEFDDGTNVDPDLFDAFLTTPAITLELPGSPVTFQLGFDGYAPTPEFGFASVEVIDAEAVAPTQDEIDDLLLRDDGAPLEIDLAAAFGAEAADFAVTTADGAVVSAAIDGATLRLSGLALGHSDLRVTAVVDGETITENFRAIVAGENAYVFAIIPDTQDYTSDQTLADNSFSRMTDWLLDQEQSLNIAHVIHVGDIVQFGAVSQWLIAEDAMERLDGEISYTLAVGNHDQQRPGFSSAFSFETDVDAYFTPEQVGATPAQGGGTYDGFDVGPDTFGNGDAYAGSIRNHYTTITTPDGGKWLIFSLEFGMPDDVLRWAGEVIEQHLDHRVIIDTHSWNGGDGRITPTTQDLNTDNGGWGYGIRENPRNVNDGEDAWRELASKYPNVTFTFNGHNFVGGAETVVSYGAGGAPVHQIFVNYQNGAWAGPAGVGSNGGNGAMRLIVVDPDNDRFTTHTKMVELDAYFEEYPDHQEVFEGVDFGAPQQIAIAKAGPTEIVAGDGISATVTLDGSATLGDTAGATFVWFAADGEKLGETDGAPLSVALKTGTNRLVLEVIDAQGAVSVDEKVVIVEAPGALLTETFDDGDADGWGAPPAAPQNLFALGTDVGFALPSLGGAVAVPLRLTFDSSFRPYDGQTGEVLVSFDEGASYTTLLTLDSTTVPGGDSSLARADEAVALDVLAPGDAATVRFAWRLSETGNDWWWAIDNVAVASAQSGRATLLAEDFENLPLGPFVSPTEGNGDGTDWTNTLPAGWTRDTTTTPLGEPVEFQGWSFLDKQSWIATAGDQARSSFTRGAGAVAVADGDEYDDGTNIDPDLFNVFLATPQIALAGHDGATLRLDFDSSFRPYDGQTGTVEVSLDGGATWSALLTLDGSTVPGGDSSLARADEAVSLAVDASGAASAMFRFGLTGGGNDWWWAVDNIAVTAEIDPLLLAEDFDDLPLVPFVSATESGGDGTDWTDAPPAGWTRDNGATPLGDPVEFQGWSFLDKQSWIATAGDQARSSFTRGAGAVAVADGDEYDDGTNIDPAQLDTLLSTPDLDISGLGGGAGGPAAGVVSVPALDPDDAILVRPTGATGRIDSYSLIFDILLKPTSAGWTSLYQTDLSNGSDGEIFFRNDGAGTASLGISGNYDGALAYGEWGRVALTYEVDGAGRQTLRKYLDGVFLDAQIVDGDVSDGSRWSIDAAKGFLLLADDNGETSDVFLNALHFTTDVLDAATIAALGGADLDGPIAESDAGAGAFQLGFEGALDQLDYGQATVAPVSFASGATSYKVKGSIFGNPDGEGEAALYQQSNGGDEIILWQGGADWRDYVFDTVIEPADNDTVGAVFYWRDAQNHYRLTMDQQNDVRTLVKVQGGVETVLAAETASYRHFAAQDLRIAVTGGRIVVTLDDEMLFDGPVDDAAPLSGGAVGFLTRGMDRVSFDNVSVNPVTLAARALTVEPEGRWGTDLDGDAKVLFDVTAEASLSAAGIKSYKWLVDGKVKATGETATLALAPGETTVTLRVTDRNGLVAEDRITLNAASKLAVLAHDDFSDGDLAGWTIVDEGTLDAPSDWSVADGALAQASNLYSTQQGTGSAAYSVNGDGPYVLRDGTHALWNDPAAQAWTDYAVEATLTPNDDDGIGLLFRYVDPENYYKLEADAQTGLVMLTRHLEGRETILARGWGEYTPGEDQRWRIEVEGGTIRTFIDGKAVFGAPVEDRAIASGAVGLYAWGSENLEFDDVLVTLLDNPLNPVIGTAASEFLRGADMADLIVSGGGKTDRIAAGAGVDHFDFSAIRADGGRNTVRVSDMQAGETIIGIDPETDIAAAVKRGGSLHVTLVDDGDRLILTGVTSVDQLIWEPTDSLF